MRQGYLEFIKIRSQNMTIAEFFQSNLQLATINARRINEQQ